MGRLKDIEALLLEILRNDGDKVKINNEIRSFDEKDWKALEHFCFQHSLKAMLYHHLSDLKTGQVPQRLLQKLKETYLFNLKRNIVLEKELFRVLGHLKKRNISAVSLKGPILSRYLYNDLTMRAASVDLDLLVKPEQYEEAAWALGEIGYAFPPFGKGKKYHSSKLEYYRQASFTRQAQDKQWFLIELHLDLRPKFCYAPLKEFWAELREKKIGDGMVLFPSNESLLIYLSLLCMTITEFVALRYLYDLYSLICRFKTELQWEKLARGLRGARYKDSIFFALTMSREFFGSDVPAHFLNEIKPGFLKRFFLSFWLNKDNILHRRSSNTRSWYYFFSSWHYFATSYLYSRNILEALKLTYRKIFPPAEYLLSSCDSQFSGKTRILYLERLLKPFTRLLHK